MSFIHKNRARLMRQGGEWLVGLSGGSRVYARVSRNAAGYIPC